MPCGSSLGLPDAVSQSFRLLTLPGAVSRITQAALFIHSGSVVRQVIVTPSRIRCTVSHGGASTISLPSVSEPLIR